MKNWKKIILHLLICFLFLFVSTITLGIIIDDNELALSICFKIVLGYIFVLSFISFLKKVNKTIQITKKENVKKILRPITWSITILPYIVLWSILVAIACSNLSYNIFGVSLTVGFIALAIYVILILIIGSVFDSAMYKENDKKDLDDLEQYVRNKDKE